MGRLRGRRGRHAEVLERERRGLAPLGRADDESALQQVRLVDILERGGILPVSASRILTSIQSRPISSISKKESASAATSQATEPWALTWA